MKLSVIMPSKNNARYLRRSIQTTLAAMPRESELLIGLHDTTDRSEEIIAEIADSRIRTLKVSGGGLSYILNALVRESKGYYIARMDSDDLCLPWRFNFQINKMNRMKVDAVFGTAVLFGPILPFPYLFPQWPLSLHTDQIKRLLVFECPLVHPSLMTTAEVLRQFPYRDCAGEDLDLWLRLVSAGMRIARTGRPVLLYRSHKSQLSRHESYLRGWRQDPEIGRMRKELATRFGFFAGNLESRKKLIKSFLFKNPLLALELSGLPNLTNQYQLPDKLVSKLVELERLAD